MNATITRRTKIGFGYNAGCSQHWNESMTQSWLAPDETERPTHTGTIKQVLDDIESDRTFGSYKSGGTYYTTAWFVKLDGKWRRIVGEFSEHEMNKLTYELDRNDYRRERYGQTYEADAVTVEIE